MESEPIIFGKNLKRKAAEKAIKKFSEEGLEKVDGEIEKSEEVSRFIGTANNYLNDDLVSFGLDNFDVDLNKIHILSPDGFEEKFPGSKTNGRYSSIDDAIYVKDLPRLELYQCLFHEMVHQASFRSFYANYEKSAISPMRVGYANYHPIEKNHEHFRGLNEAIVDKIVLESIQKHYKELAKEFRISEEEERRQPIGWYDQEMDVLDAVMRKIAEKNSESPEAVWLRFKKGEFTGEIMHVREIERAFGKGALRVLAAMGSGTKNTDFETNKKIIKYFSINDETEKDKIARDILNERERTRYDQRKALHRKNNF